MPRYIDADTVIQKLDGWQDKLAETYGINDEYVKCIGEVLDIIDDAPTVCPMCPDCPDNCPLEADMRKEKNHDCDSYRKRH